MPNLKKKVHRPKKTDTVEIDDTAVQMMLEDSRYLNAFPFLKQAKQQSAKKRSCGGCGGSRGRVTAPNLAVLRRKLANMPAVKKVKLKQLLGAQKVAVKYPKQAGGTAVKRF